LAWRSTTGWREPRAGDNRAIEDVRVAPVRALFHITSPETPRDIPVPLDQSLLDRLTEIVGPNGFIRDEDAMAPYLHEERGLYRGKAAIVVRPSTTAELAEIVAACAAARVPIVPQGGNTGLCGGASPHEDGSEIIVSLGRMNKVRAVDPINFTMTVEAGCILADVQRTAAESNCLFPLSLGAEGSCQIGGNLATNAGGINVLRYGNARDLVLGLEVVLPDGRIWSALRSLGKDNTGYALRHLFIGAEGTLGIITAAVLKLFPRPAETATALCAVTSLEAVTKLLNRARSLSGDAVTAFELIPRIGLEMCMRHIAGVTDPLEAPHPWYVLMEFSTSRPDASVRASFETLLETAFGEEIIVDAVIAESLEQRNNLWRIRESMPEAQKHEGGSIKHDVAVPVSLVPAFIAKGVELIAAHFPGARAVPFGHVGDGNIHFNISQPIGADKSAYLAQWTDMNRLVHDLVASMNGSISAEHGIGRLKVGEMKHYKDPVELDLMQRLKDALDPQNLMNPGKVLG
jgi:FAD/FMN-containing dehydrogenase